MKNNNLKPKEKKRGSKNQIPSFLLKLYQILEVKLKIILQNKEYEKIIYWGDTGKYFVVKSLSEFSEKVLPKYFKHNNFASFVRQLNMYDFHKNRNSVNENLFYHKLFIRGQKNLLKLIKRKTNTNEITQFNLNNNCSCSIDAKTGRKNSVDNVIGLMKKVEEISKSYEECEKKIQQLTQKNEEITLQNHSIIQEIYKKNDYSKKLETLLFFIIEMFLPKNTLSNLINSSEEVKKYIKSEEAHREISNNNNLSAKTNQTEVEASIEEPNPNIYANNFSEAFFHNIYEKLKEALANQHNSRFTRTNESNHYPMLLDNRMETPVDKEAFPLVKSAPISPNPYDDSQKQSLQPLNMLNREEKFGFLKTPQELNTSSYSFLGRKTAKCNKENNGNEIFRLGKPASNLNITNEEDDLQRYLESNEKNEEANKMSFDANMFLDNENLFDFNNNVSNGVNSNNNVYQSQEKEFF